MCTGESRDTFGRSDEAEKPDSRRAGALERGNRGHRAAPRSEHRVEDEEIPLCRIARNLEVVVDRLQRVMISVEADVPDARRWNEAKNPFHHPESGAQDRHERQFLSRDALADGLLERRFNRNRLEREIGRRLVGHQHRDLVDQLLEDLRRRALIAEQRHLVLHQRMAHDDQVREGGSNDRRGGVHAGQASIFARMKEYQAVMVRLTRHPREDEDALTDLLNERSRSGWEPAMMAQDGMRLTVVFQRLASEHGAPTDA